MHTTECIGEKHCHCTVDDLHGIYLQAFLRQSASTARTHTMSQHSQSRLRNFAHVLGQGVETNYHHVEPDVDKFRHLDPRGIDCLYGSVSLFSRTLQCYVSVSTVRLHGVWLPDNANWESSLRAGARRHRPKSPHAVSCALAGRRRIRRGNGGLRR